MRAARLVLAVSLLVGWTSAAAAECAWVLWKHGVSVVREVEESLWMIEEAHTNRDACEGAKQRLWDSDMKRIRKGEWTVLEQQPPNKVTIRHRGNGDLRITFLCLPDTIDPREKK